MNENESVFNESYLDRLREYDPATEEHFISYFSERLNRALKDSNLLQAQIHDIQQETFLRVWLAVRQGNLLHPQAVGSYIHATCQQVLQQGGHAISQQLEHDEKEVLREQSGLEEEMQNFANDAFLQAVLEKLPKRDREIIHARFFEERDNDDVCEQFGVNRDYLRVLLHRAIKKFEESYKKLSH